MTRRRRRRQATASRRSLGAAVVRLALVLALALVTARGADAAWSWLTTSPGFAVAECRVDGTAHADAAELRALADVEGRNVFTLDLESVRRRLLAHGWVEDVRLVRRLPNAVDVSVVEKRPLARERRDGTVVLLDGRGEVIERGRRAAAFELPWLVGASAAAVPERARRRGAELLAALADETPDLVLREVRVGRSDRLELRVEGQPAVLASGPGSVDELKAWLREAPRLRRTLGEIAQVDCRWSGRLFVTEES